MPETAVNHNALKAAAASGQTVISNLKVTTSEGSETFSSFNMGGSALFEINEPGLRGTEYRENIIYHPLLFKHQSKIDEIVLSAYREREEVKAIYVDYRSDPPLYWVAIDKSDFDKVMELYEIEEKLQKHDEYLKYDIEVIIMRRDGSIPSVPPKAIKLF